MDEIFIQGRKVGDIVFEDDRGKNIARFCYSESWLGNGFALGPDIPLIAEWQHGWFAFLRDISPDRFGRRMAREANPKVSKESQYIYCVTPMFRQGAIEFASDRDRQTDFTPLSLSAFAEMLERWNKGLDLDEPMLKIAKIAASSGGSRPKINIVDQSGNIWLAKFPSCRDDIDVPLWEAVCLDLASQCDIDIPDFRLENTPVGHALLVKRFDRENGTRLPFMSAMTALNAADGEDSSYLDMAGKMQEMGMERDFPRLYRRLLFNVLVSNRDDHLRNHGFLWKNGRWTLSPVYDLESCPDKAGHCLALDDEGNFSIPVDRLLDMAPYYNINETEANGLLKDMKKAVSKWEIIAKKYGASATDRKKMVHAFEDWGKSPASIFRMFSLI